MFLFVTEAPETWGDGLQGHVFLPKSRADAKALLLKNRMVTKDKFKAEDLTEVDHVVFHEPYVGKIQE